MTLSGPTCLCCSHNFEILLTRRMAQVRDPASSFLFAFGGIFSTARGLSDERVQQLMHDYPKTSHWPPEFKGSTDSALSW